MKAKEKAEELIHKHKGFLSHIELKGNTKESSLIEVGEILELLYKYESPKKIVIELGFYISVANEIKKNMKKNGSITTVIIGDKTYSVFDFINKKPTVFNIELNIEANRKYIQKQKEKLFKNGKTKFIKI